MILKQKLKTILLSILLVVPLLMYSGTPCNQLSPLVNSAADMHVNASIVDDVFDLGLCLGSISNLGNLTDTDVSNSTSVSMTGLACDAIISVVDTAVHPAGSFAGFEISTTGLISGSIGATIDIKTYLGGTLQDSQRVVTSSIGVNTSLLNANGHAEVGIFTTANFDEVRIEYNSVIAALFENEIYCAIVKRFCQGPSIEFDENYLLTNPTFPTSVNSELTGVNGGVCASCSVTDGNNVLDEDTTSYATINLAIGVAPTASLSVRDVLGIYPGGTIAGFAIRDVTGVLQADLFESITLCTYLDGVQQECKSGTELIDVTLLVPIIGGGNAYQVSFETTDPFDELQIEVSALVSAVNEVRVYSMFADTRVTPTSLFVDVNANSPYHTGLSWDHALKSLEEVLESGLVSSGDTIAIAQGMYNRSGNDRTASYKIPDDVVVIGGYDNNGATRDTTGSTTTLCGNVGAPGVSTDNLYHVIEIENGVSGVQIHGFTVSCGYADGVGPYQDQAGGILCLGEASIRNVIVTDNFSTDECAAVLVSGNGHLSISHSTIKSDNTSNAGIILGNDVGALMDVDPVTTIIDN